MGVLLAGIALSACTSTGKTTSADVAAATTVAYPALPDRVVTVPAAYAPDQPAAGSIAEASAIYAVASAVTPQSDAAPPAAVNAAPPAAPTTEVAQSAPTVGTEVQMASAAPEAGLADVVPASFAGPTPGSAALAAQPLSGSGTVLAPIYAPEDRLGGPGEVGARSAELDLLMAKYAEHYDVPEELVRRVAKRESTFNPKARNGPYWGLMQIRHDTAKGMGYQGTASGLLDAETNLKYAVRYLRGAWLVAKGNLAAADKLYQRGYYYDAKRAGLLDETGLGKDRRRRRNPS